MNMLVNDIDGAPVTAIYGTDGDSFFTVLQPSVLLQMEPDSPKLKQALANTKEWDNPVIAFLRPRQKISH
jgi:hypothetical protein